MNDKPNPDGSVTIPVTIPGSPYCFEFDKWFCPCVYSSQDCLSPSGFMNQCHREGKHVYLEQEKYNGHWVAVKHPGCPAHPSKKGKDNA